jgi:hypothetical protein
MKKHVPIGRAIKMGEGRFALAWAVAGIYLALSISGSICLFSHSTTHHSESHHSDSGTQSPLCAWTCQVASEGGLVASAPKEVSSLVSITPFALLIEPLSATPSPSLHSRAPPASLLG